MRFESDFFFFLKKKDKMVIKRNNIFNFKQIKIKTRKKNAHSQSCSFWLSSSL